MPAIKIYTTMLCPYCSAAKKLLQSKNLAYDETDVTFAAAERRKMSELAGGRTSVPQIWIGDHHVGGYDDLAALNASGELDRLLSENAGEGDG